jgi:hypothetical protein
VLAPGHRAGWSALRRAGSGRCRQLSRSHTGWVRSRALLAAGALLAFVLLVPAGRPAQAAPPTLAALLSRYVPILVLHPAERFQPVPVDGFLADSDLEQKSATGWEKVDGPLPSGGAALRLNQRLCNAEDGVAAVSCYADAEAAHHSRPTVYGAAFRRGKRIALQYWFFYPFDDYSPTVPAGDLWQVHEGDWESVSVLLDRTGKPLVVGLSRHGAGALRDWAKVPKRGSRPLVYVALGSHANFFGPGEHPLDPRMVPPQLIAVIKAFEQPPVDHTGKGKVVRPRLVRVTAKTPSWMTFAGTWGEDGYVHYPNHDPIVSGAGPRGPAFHKQWRAPVGDVLSWPKG